MSTCCMPSVVNTTIEHTQTISLVVAVLKIAGDRIIAVGRQLICNWPAIKMHSTCAIYAVSVAISCNSQTHTHITWSLGTGELCNAIYAYTTNDNLQWIIPYLLLPVSLSDWARGEPSNGWPECVTKIDMANNNNNERFEWIWMWTPMIDSSRFSLNAEHIYNSINEFNFALFCVGLGTFSVPPSHTKHWHWHKSAFMHRNYYLQRTVQRRFGIKK